VTAASILGAGAWGTALAVHLATRALSRPSVTLWARGDDRAAELEQSRENRRYLAGVSLPPEIAITSDLSRAVRADILIAATPAAALVPLLHELRAVEAGAPLVWLSKGFVSDPNAPAGVALPHQALGPRWPAPVGVISGPSFAEEVARGMPTAVTVVATTRGLASDAAALVRGDTLRAYESDDIAGVEVGGAIKNVLAIAAGACDGLGFGYNARAALITRGLAETARLAEALGGRRETLMGLAGLGDLVLTCTGDLSRNRRVGLALARGATLDDILRELGHVAEGVSAAKAARALAVHFNLDMPIVESVYRVLYEGLSPRDAVLALLRREPKLESPSV
jgi:glycerol-3-phosphate dehydrogenase (NAD(P)+)